MKLGLIGRIDHRGIGYQTEHYWHGLGKPRVLAVTMDDGWPVDEGRFGYDDVLFVESNLSARLTDRVLDESICRQFLKGLDVVLCVETPYDWQFCDWAREMGVKVVVVGNPEMYAHDRPVPLRGNAVYDFTHPDKWVWPTPWLLDQLPGDTILPVPCWDMPDIAAHPDTNELRILHVAGKMAAGGRNGTFEFIDSLRSIQELVHVTIVTQERRLPNPWKRRGNVEVEVITGGVDDRWDMYANKHLLVLPRKYGGLCLPALEAMSCGLAVLMSDQSPNEIWPGPRVKSRMGRRVITPAGKVETREVHPLDLANAIDAVARNRDGLRDEMAVAREFAEANNWDALRPLYRKVLGT